MLGGEETGCVTRHIVVVVVVCMGEMWELLLIKERNSIAQRSLELHTYLHNVYDNVAVNLRANSRECNLPRRYVDQICVDRAGRMGTEHEEYFRRVFVLFPSPVHVRVCCQQILTRSGQKGGEK